MPHTWLTINNQHTLSGLYSLSLGCTIYYQYNKLSILTITSDHPVMVVPSNTIHTFSTNYHIPVVVVPSTQLTFSSLDHSLTITDCSLLGSSCTIIIQYVSHFMASWAYVDLVCIPSILASLNLIFGILLTRIVVSCHALNISYNGTDMLAIICSQSIYLLSFC